MSVHHRSFSVLSCFFTYDSQLLTFYGHLVLQFVSSSLLLMSQLVALAVSISFSASGIETSRFLGYASIGWQ